MRPLTTFGPDDARLLRGLLFDLDDTLLTHGLLERAAYGALWDLHDAGLRLVAVTGRPSGWAEVLVRQWPIDGAVAENGNAHVIRDGRAVTVGVTPASGALEPLVRAIARDFPDVALADDVAARRTDVTWDIGERATVAPVSCAMQ